MTKSKLIAGTFVLFASMGLATNDLPATCKAFEGYDIQQCRDLAYFDVVPAPFSPGDVTAVFWQIGFGNDEIAYGYVGTGTGMMRWTTFCGNDSGFSRPDRRDAHAELPGSGFPAGSVCLGSTSWNNGGVDGCPDNPRAEGFSYGGYFHRGDDDILNPYFSAYHAYYGYLGYYSRASIMDYPTAVLLETPDGLHFAVAAVTNADRGNDGSGEDGPCAPNPGGNPAPCDSSPGFYTLADVSNGLPNVVDPGKNNVIPWQVTPEPMIVSNDPVDPGDPNSDLVLDLTWPAALLYSDESAKPSPNPTLAPADPNAAPGVGVQDIASVFRLVRYEVQVAAFTDPGFATLVERVECPGDPRCTSDTSAALTIPIDTCLRLQTLFGKKPRTTDTTIPNCRLGRCGDIGYHVTSPKTCFVVNCTPTDELCDGIDNDCDGPVDEDAILLEISSSINPATLNVNAQGSTFTIGLNITNVCDPADPQPMDGDLLERAWLSKAGSNSLPDPLTIPCPAPGGDFAFERGIVDNPEDRVTTQGGAALRFNLSPDGDCRTLDGDRQDLLAMLSDVPDNTEVPICVMGTVAGEPFESCTTATVKNRGNR